MQLVKKLKKLLMKFFLNIKIYFLHQSKEKNYITKKKNNELSSQICLLMI